MCVADLRIVADLSGDDLEGICGCALGRFMNGRVAGTLPPLGPSRFRGAMESELLACTAELRPDRTREVAARAVEPPDAVFEAKPVPAGARAARGESEESGFDPVAWLRGLDIRARLAALPAWAWFAIGFLILLLLGTLISRRDDRRHLLGPPPSMLPGAGAGPPPPRRPDLPRPFRLEL